MKKLVNTFVWLGLSLSLWHCKEKQVEIKSNLVNVYTDLLVAKSVYQAQPEKFLQIKNAVLAGNEVKYQELKDYLKVIEKSPQLWVKFQEQVLERIKEIESQEGKGAPNGK